MKKNKKLNKLSIFGYIILLIGLLFIILPLLGRSYNQIISNKRLDDFYKKQQERSKEDIEKEDEEIKKYNELVKKSGNTATDPFLEEENQSSFNYINKSDEIFGYIIIPKLEKRLPIYLGASMENIANGVGQVAGTSLPTGGRGNRSVLAGHRGWWDDTMLLYADELQQGDYIYIERANNTLRYIVDSKEIITPNDWDKLDPIEDVDMITLLTCHPFRAPRIKRLLINAIRDEKYYDSSYKTEVIDGKEVKKENQINFNKLEITQNNNKEIPSLVKIFNISMLAIAIIAILAFIFVLIKFIKRIRRSI